MIFILLLYLNELSDGLLVPDGFIRSTSPVSLKNPPSSTNWGMGWDEFVTFVDLLGPIRIIV